MRTLITADWHIGGYNTRPVEGSGEGSGLDDIRQNLTEMVEHALKNHIKNIFVLGDVFKNRDPEMIYLEFVAKMLDPRINWYILLGNHDMQKVKDVPHALAVYKALALPNVRIIDGPMSLALDGEEIACFPYHWAPQDQYLKEFAESFNEKAILMGHGSIEGAFMNKFLDYEIYDDDTIRYDTVAKFKAVFFGHIHEFQHISQVWYPGSVQRLTYADEGVDKCFLDVETVPNGMVNVTPIPFTHTRNLVTLTYDQIKANEIPDIKGAVVRVMGVDKNEEDVVRGVLALREPLFIYEMRTAESQRKDIGKVEDISKFNIADFVKKFADRVGYKGDLKSAEQEIVRFITDQTQ